MSTNVGYFAYVSLKCNDNGATALLIADRTALAVFCRLHILTTLMRRFTLTSLTWNARASYIFKSNNNMSIVSEEIVATNLHGHLIHETTIPQL